MGAELREPLREAADNMERHLQAVANDREVVGIRPEADEKAGQGNADWACDDFELVFST